MLIVVLRSDCIVDCGKSRCLSRPMDGKARANLELSLVLTCRSLRGKVDYKIHAYCFKLSSIGNLLSFRYHHHSPFLQ